MGFKQRFNQYYKQDKNKSNSTKEISDLTGIEESILVRKYNEAFNYPYTYGYYDLDRPLPKAQFAHIAVYKYAMSYKSKPPIIQLPPVEVVDVVMDCGGNVLKPHSINLDL